jgi:hypothetical protein
VNNGGHIENGGHLETFKGHQNCQRNYPLQSGHKITTNNEVSLRFEQKCQVTRVNVVKWTPFLNGFFRDQFFFINILRFVHCISVSIFIQIAEGVAEI